MYEAMRQHAPNSPRITGLGVTLLVASLAAWAALQAGTRIVRAIEPPTVLVNLSPRETPRDRVNPPPPPSDTGLRLPVPNIPPPLDRTFVPEDTAPTGVTPGPIATISPHPPVAPAVRIGPKLKPMDKPPYPLLSIRAREEGATTLSLCVDVRGHVSSAEVAQSSGHSRLDDAALAWVRGARFAPATIGGAPQAVCGHTVQYVWNLKTVRR